MVDAQRSKGMHVTINPTLTLTLSLTLPGKYKYPSRHLSLPAGAASSSPMAKRREARTTLIAFFQDSRAYNMGTCVRAWVGVRVCVREREKERERESETERARESERGRERARKRGARVCPRPTFLPRISPHRSRLAATTTLIASLHLR